MRTGGQLVAGVRPGEDARRQNRAPEQGNKEEDKGRGRVPNEAACERLVGSLLMEPHEEWMEEKAYLTEKEAGKFTFYA